MPRSPLAVAVSGGVDSLYALASLKKGAATGREVLALHGLFLPPALSRGKPDPLPALHHACDQLGIPLHVVDLRAAFEQHVMAPFVAAYAAGRTPNPCALCNARIKFGLLLDAALKLGAQCLATGHYAQMHAHPHYGQVLTQGQDSAKDQSYFLSLVPRERLARAFFPLARVTKAQAVAAVAAWGLTVPLPGESQEICFVPEDQYRPFVQAQAHDRGLALSGPGPMLLGTQVLGQHQGLWQYTEGQRKGLGIAHAEPLYVLAKDHAHNALVLGIKEDLAVREYAVQEINALVPRELWPPTVLARVRYRQKAALAEVEWQDTACLRLRFHQPQSPTAPGQVAALYDADGVVLAGGIIACMCGERGSRP